MKVYRVLTSGSNTELPPEGPSLVNWTQNYYYKYTHKNYTYDNCQNIKSNVLPPVSSKKLMHLVDIFRSLSPTLHGKLTN